MIRRAEKNAAEEFSKGRDGKVTPGNKQTSRGPKGTVRAPILRASFGETHQVETSAHAIRSYRELHTLEGAEFGAASCYNMGWSEYL